MNKVLIYDCESAPNLSYHWMGKYEQDIIEFVEQGYLLTFAYKWLGDKTVKAHSLKEFKGNRKKFISRLHEIFDEADIVVAHNGDEFDIKWANREFIFHGMKPPSPFKSIDTLKIARSKFNFNSNKLDDLGEYLGLGRKISTGGFNLWKSCMKGDVGAFKKMVEYNKQDVVLLEKVFSKLVPWSNKNIQDSGMICPNCGSTKIQFRGYSMSKVSISRRIQCTVCGRWGVSSNKLKIHKGEYIR